jgi:NTP pyrophosphatase (non-canonical NTP hydrolase)
MKTFAEYSKESRKTMHTDFDMTLSYLALGLTEESGEVSGQMKRVFRDDKGVVSEKRKDLLLKELGDVLWYLNGMSEKLGSSLAEVAALNIAKLKDRQQRDVLRGDGDER